MSSLSGAAMPLRTKKRKRSVFWKQRIMGYAFIAPTLLFFAIFTVTPLLLSFYYAFTDYNLNIVTTTVGFDNFVHAFKNKDFLRSFLNVFIYALMVIPLSISTALLAAVLVNKKLKGVKVYRILYYIPAVTSGVAVSYIWMWMFNEQEGIFNKVLGLFGIPGSKWLGSPNYMTMFSISIVAAWSSLGGCMLIFLAALKGVPQELYEAADVDGASPFRKLTAITLPAIAPTMYFIVTISIIGAFQLFDAVFIMVPEGLASKYANSPVFMIYNLGFHQFKAGYGTAMSLMLFAVIMITTFIMQRIIKEDHTV